MLTHARNWVGLGCALSALVPSTASALSFVQAIGLFHIVVGLLLTFTLLIFATGLVVYLSRFNTWPSHRDAAIRILEWAIAMLFVLILLIAIVNFFQHHSGIALPLLAFALIVIAAIIIVRVAASPKKKAHPARPAR